MQRGIRAATCSLLIMSMASIACAQARQPQRGDLKVGEAAPDFTVKDVHGQTSVKLSDLKGKPVVLIFGSCT
jgi:cytochrome oxidase Cu insertion factor (SCO1/SenC/PrrC family)